jgi:hypothetical protein
VIGEAKGTEHIGPVLSFEFLGWENLGIGQSKTAQLNSQAA